MLIVKEKNEYRFTVEGKAKPYVFDVNTGHMYGLRGGVLQNTPNEVAKGLRSTESTSFVIRYLKDLPLSGIFSEVVALYDKIDSIGVPYNWDNYHYVAHNTNFFRNHFKAFANYVRENAGDLENCCRQFFEEYKLLGFAETYHLQTDEHFTAEMLECLFYIAEREHYISPEHIERAAYYMARGLYDFFGGNRHDIGSHLRRFERYTELLKTEWEKGDFFRQYIVAQRDYERNRRAFENEKLKAMQMAHKTALEFETDLYQVIIPTTEEELIEEGRRQSNCVGGYGDRIRDGGCNVVFVRLKNDPDHNYITCDVRVRYGGKPYINQFLRAYNSYNISEQDKEFKELYLAHLLENWDKGE